MGDLRRWCAEREEEQARAEHKDRCDARKNNVDSVKLNDTIHELLKILRKQQLSSCAWRAVDRLDEVWYGGKME